MRTHNPKTIRELKAMNAYKADLFKDMDGAFDYAMPQGWLDSFSDWCKQADPTITYELIRSTTVWAYQDSIGRPVTCCKEVASAYRWMEGCLLAGTRP